MLDRLVPDEALLDKAKPLARQIAICPPVAMQVSRRMLQHGMESDLEEAVASSQETRPPVYGRVIGRVCLARLSYGLLAMVLGLRCQLPGLASSRNHGISTAS